MAYDYIKRTYSFTPEVGRKVRHTVTGKNGEIRRESRSQSHYVMVRFDGQKHSLPCHPGELVYVPSEAHPDHGTNIHTGDERTTPNLFAASATLIPSLAR